MKKFLSILLSISMVLGLLTSTAYANNASTKHSATKFESIGHGEFRIAPSNSIASDEVEDVEIGKVIIAYPTNDEEIFKISKDKYLLENTSNSYLLTDKINIDTENFDKNQRIFSKYSISSELITNMQEVVDSQKKLGNTEFSIELYAPSILNDKDMPSMDSISERVAEAPKYTNYKYKDKTGYTWNMRDCTIAYRHLHAGPVKKEGTSALSLSKAFANVVVSGAGIASTTISVFGVGKSLYDLYKAAKGPVISGSGGDLSTAVLIYDRLQKETSMMAQATGKYMPGKNSHKVWFNRLDTYQLYGSNGQSFSGKNSINKTYYSKHWNDSEAALSRIDFEDYLRVKLYDVTIVLKGT